MDLIGAATYYQWAADQGFAPGQLACAVGLMGGTGFRRDLGESARYLRLAACSSGQVDGASGEPDFVCPLNRTIIQALSLRAVSGRSAVMLHRLGKHLADGSSIGKDLTLAAECYRLAAERDPPAQRDYGLCLEHGLGVERNAAHAVEFYEKSMNGNDPIGTRQYALCLHFAPGCDADLEHAADHYESCVGKNRQLCCANSARRSRALNQKGRVLISHTEAGTVKCGRSDQDGSTFDILAPIAALRVESIRPGRGGSLGRGFFACVTREQDRRTGKDTIAVKRLFSRCPDEKFVREVEILSKLHHPCVIQIVGWSIGGSNALEIQMRLVANGALSHALQVGRSWSDTQKAVIVCGIVLGMRYVHSQGIIHRDLKPGNIFLDEDWHAVIGDFGLGRFGSAEGPPTPEAYTKLFAAPEQLQVGVSYTEKVDVFAFGLVLCELIEGFVAVRIADGWTFYQIVVRK
jgi:hypothetical protein